MRERFKRNQKIIQALSESGRKRDRLRSHLLGFGREGGKDGLSALAGGVGSFGSGEGPGGAAEPGDEGGGRAGAPVSTQATSGRGS